MSGFEMLVSEHRGAVERYVRFNIPTKADSDDVLQEVWLAAYRQFDKLKNKSSFKAWVIGIARHKVKDYFRSRRDTLDIDELPESELVQSRYGLVEYSPVYETIDKLSENDKQILTLYYFENMPQNEIADKLGRAIVRNPQFFMLDEPLSNLDAKLRAQMRTKLAKLHKKLGTTFIYVTHDQIEAMTMGDRIVVMKDCYVQQIDTPINLYDNPVNKFVAGFIGTPQMNFFAECADGICPILRIQTSEMSEKEQFELIGKKKLSLKVRESTVNIFDTVDGRNLAVVNAVPVPDKHEADIGTGGSDKKKKKDK